MQSKDTSTVPFNNPLIRFISEKKYRWLRHTLFFIIGLLLALKGDLGSGPDHAFRKALLIMDVITFVFIMGMVYLLLFVFIPRLLFRSRFFYFLLSFLLIITLCYILVWQLDKYFLKGMDLPGFQHIDFSLLNFIQVGAVCAVLLGAVVGLKVFKKWISDVQRMNELQRTSLEVELQQLKSQVNPHFLFNTLNNLLVLTKTDPERASAVLLGLSDLLRYQLYDSSKDRIVLSKDIAFLHNFLALEKIRKNDFEYNIHTEGNMDSIMLPPFLFIPFVENAVKHGASTVGHSYLTLDFKINEQGLHFHSENSKPSIKQNTVGGLGLANIKRRLELLYPDNHRLQITDNSDNYIVNLTIPL